MFVFVGALNFYCQLIAIKTSVYWVLVRAGVRDCKVLFIKLYQVVCNGLYILVTVIVHGRRREYFDVWIAPDKQSDILFLAVTLLAR